MCLWMDVSGECLWGVSLRCVTGVCLSLGCVSGVCLWRDVSGEGAHDFDFITIAAAVIMSATSSTAHVAGGGASSIFLIEYTRKGPAACRAATGHFRRLPVGFASIGRFDTRGP